MAANRAKDCTFGFEPGDIVSEVMSFGSPTPIEILVASPNIPEAVKHADKIRTEMAKIPWLRDVQFHESLAYPSVEIDIDREKAGLSGVTAQQVGNAAIVATSTSRFIALNYWQNPKTGFDYQVEVLVPTQRMTSIDQVSTLPIEQVNNTVNLMVRDIANVRDGHDGADRPHLVAALRQHHGERRRGRHGPRRHGRSAAVRAAGEPPRGVRVMTRGQFPPMIDMFTGLGIGLGDRRRGDLDPVDCLLRIAAAGHYCARGRARRALGHRHYSASHGHDAEPGIVHGNDHVHRRFGIELRDARHVRQRTLARWHADHASRH